MTDKPATVPQTVPVKDLTDEELALFQKPLPPCVGDTFDDEMDDD